MADEPEEKDETRATFASLPLALAQHGIFARLSVDVRLRCAEVCRAWRAALRERSLWLTLNMSSAFGGVMRVRTREEAQAADITTHGAYTPRTLRRFDELLRAAAVRADGGLQVLDASYATHAAVLDVVTANGGALRELALSCSPQFNQVAGAAQLETLLRAAPRLRCLRLWQVHLSAPGALDVVVDAAVTCRMERLSLSCCALSPASAPALVRLLRDGALSELRLWNCGTHMLDEPFAALLARALRANCTLTQLHFLDTELWRSPAAAAALMGALTGHASLRELDVGTYPGDEAAEPDAPLTLEQSAAAGAAFGALIAANAPALEALDVSSCGLGDAELAPLADALRQNTHLQSLRIHPDSPEEDMYTFSAAVVRDRLLPAARANRSLRALSLGSIWEEEVRLVLGQRGRAAAA
jgi:hypothetical protein